MEKSGLQRCAYLRTMLAVVMLSLGSMQLSPRRKGGGKKREEVRLTLVALSVEPPSQMMLYSV